MGARKTPRAAAKSSRAGRNAVARARSGRRAGMLWIAATIVVSGGLLGAVIVSIAKNPGDGTSDADAQGLSSSPATVAVGADTPPPWPAPADAAAAVRAAGLPMMSSEGAVEHIHAHLDVLVDGRPVPVRANIGVDTRRGTMSALHSHDDTGLIHIESPAKRQFSLGEFFSEWGVSLSADNIGALRATDGKSMRVFVNGEQRPGNPAAITFGPRDEIALVYGAPQPGETIPSTYDFGEGQ